MSIPSDLNSSLETTEISTSTHNTEAHELVKIMLGDSVAESAERYSRRSFLTLATVGALTFA